MKRSRSRWIETREQARELGIALQWMETNCRARARDLRMCVSRTDGSVIDGPPSEGTRYLIRRRRPEGDWWQLAGPLDIEEVDAFLRTCETCWVD